MPESVSRRTRDIRANGLRVNILPNEDDEEAFLDAAGRPSPSADPLRFREQMDAAMSRFLVVELEVGRTFARAAINASWTQDLLHYRKLARKAYDTARRLMVLTRLSENEARELARELQTLKLTLSQLGDPP